VREVRIWVVGLGTVGRWLLRALDSGADRLERSYGFRPLVVGAASSSGFVEQADGLDAGVVLDRAEAGAPLEELPGVRSFPTALEGMAEGEADVLLEVTGSPMEDGEPGLSHIAAALERGIPVATSNKWPVALRGVELLRRAREAGTTLRAESTVMSGTPVLSALTEGLAGSEPIGLRGVLNATVNFILTRMAGGESYERALAEAERIGLAERDPSADVDGHDEAAKLMILAGLVFGVQLSPGEVARRGISGIDRDEIEAAVATGGRVRSVATIERDGEAVKARVVPEALAADDPLARIDGTMNAIVHRADPVGEVRLMGPGAGPQLAGQGVFSDLIAIARGGAGR
jgi:homoserine dehydrogenase